MTATTPPSQPRRMSSMRRKRIIKLIGTYTILLIVVAIVLFPFYWMVITSLKLPREIYRVPSLWPEVFTWNNFDTLITEKDFLVNMKNSLIVATSVTVISLFISSFAAYSLVLDFDFIEKGAEQGLPKYMEWYGAYGLLVEVIWLYIEILRLLAKLRNR